METSQENCHIIYAPDSLLLLKLAENLLRTEVTTEEEYCGYRQLG
jgi:hypothetical protein